MYKKICKLQNFCGTFCSFAVKLLTFKALLDVVQGFCGILKHLPRIFHSFMSLIITEFTIKKWKVEDEMQKMQSAHARVRARKGALTQHFTVVPAVFHRIP